MVAAPVETAGAAQVEQPAAGKAAPAEAQPSWAAAQTAHMESGHQAVAAPTTAAGQQERAAVKAAEPEPHQSMAAVLPAALAEAYNHLAEQAAHHKAGPDMAAADKVAQAAVPEAAHSLPDAVAVLEAAALVGP